MTSTTPFLDENDEELGNRISLGFRPKWPPNIPQMWLREQIEACWDQNPNERPTAFEVLLALLAPSKGQRQEPVASAGDRVTTMEQVHVDDHSEECTFLDRL